MKMLDEMLMNAPRKGLPASFAAWMNASVAALALVAAVGAHAQMMPGMSLDPTMSSMGGLGGMGVSSGAGGMAMPGGGASSAGAAGAAAGTPASPTGPAGVPSVDISNIPVTPATPVLGPQGVPIGAAQPTANEPDPTGSVPGAMRLPSVPSAFEKFVLAATGRVLRPYGANLFAVRSFAPVNRAAVPGDYVLAPGDEILIYAWGGISINFRATVDRAGQINIPRVGAFTVAGIRAADLENNLRNHISRYFTNFQLSASVSQVRGVQVYVVGQAAAPGMYTLPGTSTLVSAIFQVAEPGPNGSYRRIQLKRANQTVSEFDLYDFIAKGDSGADVRLVSGDVIVIPPAGPRVAVLGVVDNPAIYEIKPDSRTLDDVLKLAGFERALADSSRVQLERVNPADTSAPRSVLDVPMPAMGKTTLLADGDLVSVLEGKANFANAVTLRGSVALPLRHAFRPGMKVRDLIPNKDALITPDYFRRSNALVQRLDDDGRLREKYVEGFIRDEAKANYRLTPSNDGKSAPATTVVRNLLDEINWDYAVVERLDKDALKPTLLPFNLSKALADANSADNLQLKPGDVVTVFSVRDVAVPKARRAAIVRVAGEVKAPGYYTAEPGETLRDIIRRAGGFTGDAFIFGSELRRESTRLEQEKRYNEALNQLEKDLSRSGTAAVAGALSPEDVAAKQAGIESQRRLLERLRTVKPTGRVVLALNENARALADLPNMPLEDGDVFDVPPRPATVNVFGSVFGEGAYLISPGDSIGDMIAQAGGPVRTADAKSTFVIRPNGSVVSARQTGLNWIAGLNSRRALPGDTIVVPEDYERVPTLRFARDLSIVFGQLGLGIAALRSINR